VDHFLYATALIILSLTKHNKLNGLQHKYWGNIRGRGLLAWASVRWAGFATAGTGLSDDSEEPAEGHHEVWWQHGYVLAEESVKMPWGMYGARRHHERTFIIVQSSETVIFDDSW